ncbi:FAD-binding domain-containing protein 74 [Elsinoe fawcettii]|nr:FAD-binding domain-containing protein 74 [Elsinoe fawcettii]
MRFTSVVAISLPALALAQNGTSGPACACNQLASITSANASALVRPNDALYLSENRRVWDQRSNQNPACIYLPSTAQEAASAVEVISECKATFVIRGGGHLPVPGSNNIEGGVLLSLNRLVDITLSEDKATVAVGAGNRWREVYQALEPEGLYVIGGRLSSIGVAGVTLGGGVNYLINKYGFSMDQVVSYEVVVGNGTLVTASAQSEPDLFWALKGGNSNFGLVTSFNFKTIEVPSISTSIIAVGEDGVESYIRAFCDFVDDTGNNPSQGAGSVSSISYNVTNKRASASFIGVTEGTDNPSPRFAGIAAVPGKANEINNVSTPFGFQGSSVAPLNTFRQVLLVPLPPRRKLTRLCSVQFGHHTIRTDADRLIEIYREWRNAADALADVEGFAVTFVLNGAPKSAATVALTNGVGNAWGLADDDNYIWWQFATNWRNAEDDLRVTSWSNSLLERLHRENVELGLATEFLYAGDTNEFQNVYLGFPQENQDRLFEIRERYDPEGVFKSLNFGGYKLGF